MSGGRGKEKKEEEGKKTTEGGKAAVWKKAKIAEGSTKTQGDGRTSDRRGKLFDRHVREFSNSTAREREGARRQQQKV